jgi:hypothetical protein
VIVYAFNEKAYEVPPRRGFVLRDALAATKNNWSRGGLAVAAANRDGYDRIIVITDGQWHFSDTTTVQGYGEGDPQTVAPDSSEQERLAQRICNESRRLRKLVMTDTT